MEKISFSFFMLIFHLVVLWASYYTCKIFSEMWAQNFKNAGEKSNFHNQLKKWYEMSPFWSTHFLKKYCSVNLMFSYFSERSYKVKESLKYFWLTTMLVVLEIKISLVSIKKSFYQCDPPYTRPVSWRRVQYRKFLSSYNISTIYLHVIEAYIKVTIAVLFLQVEKSFRYYGKYF